MIRFAFTLALLAMIGTPAAAYIGPGAGIGAIGTAIGALVAVVLLLVGFVWYPLRRVMRKRREAKAAATGNALES